MSKNRKPRKAYRPRDIRSAAGLEALDRRMPMHNDQTTDLGIAYHVALEEMIRGRGTEEHWSTVVCALNIALVLAEMGFAAHEIGIISDAIEGAVRARDRARAVGKWGFDGDALLHVKQALEIHDAQMAIVPKASIIAALAEVHRRIDSGNAFREAA